MGELAQNPGAVLLDGVPSFLVQQSAVGFLANCRDAIAPGVQEDAMDTWQATFLG
jgi:hypothetical protein